MDSVAEVRKKIILDDFKGRMGTYIPSYNDWVLQDIAYEGYNDYGNIPYDIVVSDIYDELEHVDFSSLTEDNIYHYQELSGASENIPLFKEKYGDNERERLILRYGTMSSAYAQLMDFAYTCRYYVLICRPLNSTYSYRWSEMTEEMFAEQFDVHKDIDGVENVKYNIDKLLSNEWVILSELPEPLEDGYEGSHYLCINDEESVNAFKSRFFDKDGNRQYERFYRLVDEFFKNKYDGEESSFLDKPSAYLPLCVNEESKDFGVYEPFYEEWVQGKGYTVGMVVHYTAIDDNFESGFYKLNTGEYWKTIEIPYTVYNANSHVYDEEQDYGQYYTYGEKYFLKKKYYSGYTHNGVVLFDSKDGNGNPVHWKKLSTITSDRSIETEGTCFIRSLTRKVKSYDKEENELPFNIDRYGSSDGEMRYYTESNIEGNYIEYINFVDEDGTENTAVSNPPTTNTVLDTAKYVKFIYYTDALFNENDEFVNGYGVKHEETYPFKKVTKPVHTDEVIYDYNWVVVDWEHNASEETPMGLMPYPSGTYYEKYIRYTADSEDEPIVYDAYNITTGKYESFYAGGVYTCYPFVSYIDIDYSTTYHYDEDKGTMVEDESPRSITTIYQKAEDEKMIDGLIMFHNSEKDSIDYIDSEISIDIERGKYAAYERHNRLGEVNTFEDLEQLRNDMFGLKQQ